MKPTLACWFCALSFGCLATISMAADAPPAAPAKKLSYYKDIRPVFQASCQGCHQPAKASGEYVMTNFARMLKGGESAEVAIVPAKPDESKLIALITPGADGKAEMPKDHEPLTADQIAKIRTWITEGAADDTPESVRVVIDPEHPPVYEGLPVLTSVAYSPDGTLLAVSGYHEVLLWKADGSEMVGRLVGQSERIESAEFSPDGKWLAVTGGSPARMGEVQIWDVATRKLQLSLPVTFDTVYGVCWSPDNTRVSFGCATDNSVRVIEAATGKQVLFNGAHNDWVLDTVFSKDASHVISVGRDRSMKLIEVATQRFVDNITSITPGALKGGLEAVDRHPQKDELLIGGADGIPKVYKMIRTQARVIGDDYNLIKAYEVMPGRIYDVAFSPDGSKFAAGSSLDGTGEVRVYETDSGKLLHKLAGQKGGVFAVRFSPDGKTVASAGFDGLVRLNSVETGAIVKEFAPAPVAERKLATAK
jgi:WD40 repeat protein